MGRTPVNGDLLRHAMTADRLRQEPLGRLLVTVLCEEQVNRLACCIDGARERAPLALDLDGRFPPSASCPTPAVCGEETPLPAGDDL